LKAGIAEPEETAGEVQWLGKHVSSQRTQERNNRGNIVVFLNLVHDLFLYKTPHMYQVHTGYVNKI
jgi:hypothetical protein